MLSSAKCVRVLRNGRMILRRKSRSTWRKTCNITTSSTKIHTWNFLRSKLWLCLDKLRLTKPWHGYQLIFYKFLFRFIFVKPAIKIAISQDLILAAFLKTVPCSKGCQNVRFQNARHMRQLLRQLCVSCNLNGLLIEIFTCFLVSAQQCFIVLLFV